jgi:two-component system sensor histidine kinase KdpD
MGDLLGKGTRPAVAAGGGIAIVVVAGVALAPFADEAPAAMPALIFVVPVVLASVVGGRWAAYAVAVAATLAFSLLLPPVGSPEVHVEEDLAALVGFTIVAFVVSSVVVERIETLGEIERQRSALLRSVSHDLRTPLSVIRGGSTELLETEDASGWRYRMLQLIASESERLDRLVGNLLSMSRIEAGALRPQRQAVDLAELLEFCTRRLGRLFANVRLLVDVAPEVGVVDVDHTQLDQVFTNLLENAVRHSPPGGTVRVTVREGLEGVVVVVADDGPGIDANQAEAVFQPFRRDAPDASSGIGLAICRAVIEAHGGHITVGRGVGGGAEFTFALPHR